MYRLVPYEHGFHYAIQSAHRDRFLQKLRQQYITKESVD